MSFPKYPEYKDSGVEWFGDVPCDWRVQRLKQVVNPSRPITYGIVQAGENVPDGIPYIRPADMADESGVKTEDALLRTSQEIASAYRRSSISAGDIVCSIGPSFGKLMMVPLSLEGANLTQGTARVAVANEHVPRFIFWVLRSVESYQQWESSVGGATFRALNLGPLAETFLCVPSWAEQTQIARFLDHETARIDVLIEEQQRLIELLKEKRQAVISHAVTKGLDPTVPMKDSGVEWLGEVPAHWTIKKGGHIGVLFGSEAVPEDMVNDYGNLPFLKVGSLSADTLSIRQWDFFVDESIERSYRPKNRFIVFPKRGAAIFLNKVNVVEVSALLDPNLMGWEMQAGNNAYYFANVLKCRGLSELADVSTVPQINNKHISPEKFPVPPYAEQNGIVAFLDTEISRFDQLVTEAEHGVSLLQERRSALISAAVTGKIDVRDWRPPVSTQTPESAVAEAH